MKKTDIWLIIEETIGGDTDSKHVVDVCMTRDEAIKTAENIELHDNASKCYVTKYTLKNIRILSPKEETNDRE